MEKFSAAMVDQLKKEAGHGIATAQYLLAGAFFNGNGVTRNVVEGAEWLHKAAQQGHVPAQCDLGVMYQKGVGVEQSYKDSLKWYHAAAEQGDTVAQHNLGSLNAKGFRPNGLGWFNRTGFAFMKATQDFVEAYKWFSLAGAGGHQCSLTDRNIIKRRMTPGQIAKAEELVEEFQRARSRNPAARQ
jgi:uncharacterized protein